MIAGNVQAWILVLLILRVGGCEAEDEDPAASGEVEESKKAGAEYLRKVMSRLQSERSEGRPIELTEANNMNDVEEDMPEMSAEATNMHKEAAMYDITAPTPVPSLQAEIIPAEVPQVPPGLTADELKAIYNAAINKLVNLPPSQSVIKKPTSQLYHPPPPPPPSPSPSSSNVIEPAAHGPAGNLLPGYYYYYYPIKSFVQTLEEPTKAPPPTKMPPPPTKPKPVDMHVTVMESPNKGVEPLFVAISSFIGMALMFAFSVLFVPKFGKLRSGDGKDTTHHGDFIALGRVVLDSLEGKDCAERLACELGHFLWSVKMEDKPLRVLEIILPPHLSKQVTLVRKAAGKHQRCPDIPCRLKKKTKKHEEEKQKKKKVVTRKPWRKTQTRHDLWMQHFQNRTAFKQPENIWERNRVRRRTLPHSR